MNLLRKLKIGKLIPVEFTDAEKDALTYLEDWLIDVKEFVDESEPNIIRYMKYEADLNKATYVFSIDNENKLYVRIKTIESLERFNIDSFNACLLIRYVLEKYRKSKFDKCLLSRAYNARYFEQKFLAGFIK